MTDERQLERAEAYQNELLDREIQRHRSKLPPPGQFGPEHCRSCLADMPMERRQHGFEHCVECATIAEEKRRGFR